MGDAELLELGHQLGDALKAKGWKLALAESCTGGLACALLTGIAGSSAWFERGFVTYSNESKVDLLGVKLDSLIQYGAVSEQVVAEMAQGVFSKSQAQIVAAISGIAGPSGGTAEKPIGMVYMSCLNMHQQQITTKHFFTGSREEVRLQSVKTCLKTLTELTLSTDL